MTSQKLRIATRTSELALWQAKFVGSQLQQTHPGLQIELTPMKTQGDKNLDAPLAKIGGKGLFVKELEVALIENRADIAVHSMKDVPMHLPEELTLAAIGQRACPWDALVGPHTSLSTLPTGAKVGTSSLRRLVQLMNARPDLEIVPLRGNVTTRLEKLKTQNLDAIILASAGLERLNLSEHINLKLDLGQGWLPAFCQGVIGIECRRNDAATQALIHNFNHPASALTTAAERALNRKLDGGCQVPLGGYAHWVNAQTLRVDAFVSNGRQYIRAHHQSQINKDQSLQVQMQEAEALGILVAEQLIALKAAELLADARKYFDPFHSHNTS